MINRLAISFPILLHRQTIPNPEKRAVVMLHSRFLASFLTA